MSDEMKIGKVELAPMQHNIDLHQKWTLGEPKPPKRVAVQFFGGEDWTVALANDGSIWELIDGRWTRLPDLPQE